VLDLERDAEIGLVAAETLHRIAIGQTRKWNLELAAQVAAEHRREHSLDDLEDIVLGDERHLEIDLGELGLSVGAQVLVPQASGDLEVAIEARDHEDL